MLRPNETAFSPFHSCTLHRACRIIHCPAANRKVLWVAPQAERRGSYRNTKPENRRRVSGQRSSMDTAPSFVAAGPAESARAGLSKERSVRDGAGALPPLRPLESKGPWCHSATLPGPVVLRAPNAAKGRLGFVVAGISQAWVGCDSIQTSAALAHPLAKHRQLKTPTSHQISYLEDATCRKTASPMQRVLGFGSLNLTLFDLGNSSFSTVLQVPQYACCAFLQALL